MLMSSVPWWGGKDKTLGNKTSNAPGCAENSENAEIVHNDQELFRKTAHPALKTVRTNR